MALTPESEIRFLRGVGEQRMKKYQKLGVTTVEDLPRHAPRNYLDLRRPAAIREVPLGERGAVAGLAQLGLLPTRNSRLSPKANLTRADMALLLHRAMTQ